jgi:hypothetical protein
MAIELSDCSATGTELRFDPNSSIPPQIDTRAAFIGRANRGPLNEAVEVSSFENFRRIFGGHGPLGFLSHAVQQFFQHGGQSAAVVRVANNATRARLDLPAQGEIFKLYAREPGSHALLRASVDYDGIGSNDQRFNLVVQRLARPGSQLVEDQELFRAVSMDETEKRFVVDVLRSSELVQLGGPLPARRPDATRAEHPGQPLPYVEMSCPGHDGDELTDYDIIGSNDERTGLFAFDELEQIDLVNIPLLASGRDHGCTTFFAAERYCSKRRATLIWDPPWSWSSVESALIGVRASGLSSPNALSYFPRVCFEAAPERHKQGIPAGGAVAGILARADRSPRWHTLDDGDAQLRGGLVPLSAVSERQAEMLERRGLNAFVTMHRRGAELSGNASLAGAGAAFRLWQRLDRRRLLFHILGSLERYTRWVLFTDWNRELEQRVVRQIDGFLRVLFERGALCGSRAEQAYFVKLQGAVLGEERELVLRIGVALDKPNEFQIYDVVHRPEQSFARPAPLYEAAQLAS